MKKKKADHDYEQDEETKALADKFEAAKAYLEKSQAVKEKMVEELAQALGQEIGSKQLFTLAVSVKYLYLN